MREKKKNRSKQANTGLRDLRLFQVYVIQQYREKEQAQILQVQKCVLQSVKEIIQDCNYTKQQILRVYEIDLYWKKTTSYNFYCRKKERNLCMN